MSLPLELILLDSLMEYLAEIPGNQPCTGGEEVAMVPVTTLYQEKT